MTRCTKRRYRTRVDALLALSRTQHAAAVHARHQKANDRAEQRAYRCPACLGWHLTSQEVDR